MLILLCILLISGSSISGQDNESILDKFYTGGNLGLSFGTITLINVNPLLGYKVSSKVHVGLTGTYQYYSQRSPSYETSVYGGSVFGRYLFRENLFGHVEIERLIGEWLFGENAFAVTSVFVGGGYLMPVGANSAISFMGLFNLNEGTFSPYTNPVIRVGFNLGL